MSATGIMGRGVGRAAALVAPLLLLAGSLAAVVAAGGPQLLRARLGSVGLAGAVLVHALLNLTPAGELVPSSVANGAVFGVVAGAGANWTGWMLASLCQYGAARRLRARAPAGLDGLPRWLRRWPVDHLFFQVLGRSLPWLGNHATNLASGCLRVPLPRFLVGAGLGLLGPAFVMAAVGAGLVRLF
jgi:uncharacterized membrane protein YdjX (TVP38/TMEM64 family)